MRDVVTASSIDGSRILQDRGWGDFGLGATFSTKRASIVALGNAACYRHLKNKHSEGEGEAQNDCDSCDMNAVMLDWGGRVEQVILANLWFSLEESAVSSALVEEVQQAWDI